MEKANRVLILAWMCFAIGVVTTDDKLLEIVNKKLDRVESKLKLLGEELSRTSVAAANAIHNVEKLLAGLTGITKRNDLSLQRLTEEVSVKCPANAEAAAEAARDDILRTEKLEQRLSDALAETLAEMRAKLDDQTAIFRNSHSDVVSEVKRQLRSMTDTLTARINVTYVCSSFGGIGEEGILDFPITTTEAPKLRSCSEVQLFGDNKRNGVYDIYPGDRTEPVRVYCNMEDDGGGWTVIQRHGSFFTPPEDFNRSWTDYKQGFGEVEKEFWIGNANLHLLTNQEERVMLYIVFHPLGFRKLTVQFDWFLVANETDYYRLMIGPKLSSNLNTTYLFYNLTRFSTFDANDFATDRVALLRSGWWYREETLESLNLDFREDLGTIPYKTEMRIRSNAPPPNPANDTDHSESSLE